MSINSKTMRQRNRTGIHGRKKNSSAISSLTKFSQTLLNIKGLATKKRCSQSTVTSNDKTFATSGINILRNSGDVQLPRVEKSTLFIMLKKQGSQVTFLPFLNQAGKKNKSTFLPDAVTPVSACRFKIDPLILKEIICALNCLFCNNRT